jgi:hypothetical protein
MSASRRRWLPLCSRCWPMAKECLMHLMTGFAIGQQRLQSGSQRLRLALILQQLFDEQAADAVLELAKQ